tara:strand:- start:61324 stop:61536 length:213 start_codon:yes stop_codon:yes gene_type:complete
MPKFPMLDKFAHGCINLRKENYTVSNNDARSIANEYTRMLEYITQLQDKIIQLQDKQNNVIEVELDGDTF